MIERPLTQAELEQIKINEKAGNIFAIVWFSVFFIGFIVSFLIFPDGTFDLFICRILILIAFIVPPLIFVHVSRNKIG